MNARLTQLVPISFCNYNFGRDSCCDWNGPGFCFCMQSRLQVSRKLRLCTSSKQHSQERMGPDRSGKSVLKAITSFEMQSSSKIFSGKRHLKHVLREQKEMQIRKKIFKFLIVLHTTSSALQFYEMCCIYILLYSVFLCICFSVRLFNSSAEHVSFHQTFQSSTLLKNGSETRKRHKVLFWFTIEFHQTISSISILLYIIDI